MSRHRNPEYEKRDLAFVHTCEVCSRTNRCDFKTSLEGPEGVCKRLIEDGTYNCESCIRRNIGGGCTFSCVFFVKQVPLAPPVPVTVVKLNLSLAEETHRNSRLFVNAHGALQRDLGQEDTWD